MNNYLLLLLVSHVIFFLFVDKGSSFQQDCSSSLWMIHGQSKNWMKMKAFGSKSNAELFVCESCGTEHIKWMGRCSNCKEWNSIKTFKPSKLVSSLNPRIANSFGNTNNPLSTLQNQGKWLNLNNEMKEMMLLSSVSEDESIHRIEVFSQELNRVLGGGLVPGSVVLLTGEPGIGKSTLLLQLAASVGQLAGKVIYLSGEENPQQISMRARRLGIDRSAIYLLCEMDIDTVFAKITVMDSPPSLLIVDSIQTISTEMASGGVGSVSQIRESTAKIIQYAKTFQIPVILVGHVTKSGDVAGPKVLEHMVDTVLSLEGSDKFDYRIIRCEKNRFGSVSEVGVFSMSEVGMIDVINPSELFFTENVLKEPQEGSTVVITLEGTRCLLAEVQCLVGATHSNPNVKMNSKRASDGFPIQRLLLLCAVIEKRLKLQLWNRDVYMNIVGGLSITEPSADLAVAIAIISSLLSISVIPATAFIGEIGLGGEIRGSKRIEQRIMEAVKLGFRRIILPQAALKASTIEAIRQKTSLSMETSQSYEIIACSNLRDAAEKGLMLNGKTWEEMKSGIRRRTKQQKSMEERENLGIDPSFDSEDFTNFDYP